MGIDFSTPEFNFSKKSKMWVMLQDPFDREKREKKRNDNEYFQGHEIKGHVHLENTKENLNAVGIYVGFIAYTEVRYQYDSISTSWHTKSTGHGIVRKYRKTENN